MKSVYQHIREAWKKPRELEAWKGRIFKWRREDAITTIEKPTRLDRAHELGYKAKKGFTIVRVRLMRGGRRRPRHKKGRKQKRQTIKKQLLMNYRWVAEQRAERRFPNMTVLNSYWVAQDGEYYWFEIILVDRNRPEIAKDKKLNWICNVKGRAMRGLTSAAKKSRGLR